MLPNYWQRDIVWSMLKYVWSMLKYLTKVLMFFIGIIKNLLSNLVTLAASEILLNWPMDTFITCLQILPQQNTTFQEIFESQHFLSIAATVKTVSIHKGNKLQTFFNLCVGLYLPFGTHMHYEAIKRCLYGVYISRLYISLWSMRPLGMHITHHRIYSPKKYSNVLK